MEYTVTAETVEADIKRQLTYAQSECLKQIEKFREDMSVTESVTHMLNWDSAPVIAAEFSYYEYTMTLGRVGREEVRGREGIRQQAGEELGPALGAGIDVLDRRH